MDREREMALCSPRERLGRMVVRDLIRKGLSVRDALRAISGTYFTASVKFPGGECLIYEIGDIGAEAWFPVTTQDGHRVQLPLFAGYKFKGMGEDLIVLEIEMDVRPE